MPRRFPRVLGVACATISLIGSMTPSARAQTPSPASTERAMLEGELKKLREAHFGADDRPKPQVLLFGTFHFANPGLDAHKPKYTYDVFSERGQKELNEVLDRLEKYKPTKIIIERASSDPKGIDAWFEGYKKGHFPKNPNESLTVGFALAQRLGHTKVYGFDAAPRWFDGLPETNADWKTKAKAMGMDDRLESKTYAQFPRFYQGQDELFEKLTLRQRLLLMNHPDMLSLSHGAYFFFAHFEMANGTEFPGPDGFCTSWHNRNLRMFSNLQRLASEPSDRLLVITGAGHVPILQHCVKNCPTMKWVDMWDVLGKQ